MRSLFFSRTTILLLAEVCTCFASSPSASQEKALDWISRSAITGNISTTATNHTVAPEKSNDYINDKNHESRSGPGKGIIRQGSEALSRASEYKIAPSRLRRIMDNFRSRRQLPQKETMESARYVLSLMSSKDLILFVKARNFKWDDQRVREQLFGAFVNHGISPPVAFVLMKPQLLPLELQSDTVGLRMWFKYIEQYNKHVRDENTIEMNMRDSARSYEEYDKKKLYDFLVKRYNLRLEREASSSAHVSPEAYSRHKVEELFALLRDYQDTKKFAEDMQL